MSAPLYDVRVQGEGLPRHTNLTYGAACEEVRRLQGLKLRAYMRKVVPLVVPAELRPSREARS